MLIHFVRQLQSSNNKSRNIYLQLGVVGSLYFEKRWNIENVLNLLHIGYGFDFQTKKKLRRKEQETFCFSSFVRWPNVHNKRGLHLYIYIKIEIIYLFVFFLQYLLLCPVRIPFIRLFMFYGYAMTASSVFLLGNHIKN